jgi:hypothetical protein
MRAVFDRWEEAGLTEIETTPAGPKGSVVGQCSKFLIWPGQIAYLVTGLLVGRVAVAFAYLQWAGAEGLP